jgi:methyltransferase (TIGR00027 family)
MPRGTSLTALAVCFFRAAEHARGPARRALDDAYAARLLPGPLAALAEARGTREALLGRWDLGLGPASLARYVVARHRVIDEALLAFVAAGGRQVVILGAGLDARAWRFSERLREVRVWEVDFPATQAEKRARFAEAGLADGGPTFLAVDFERTRLDEALVAAGLDTGAPTLFLWEGVTMYLEPHAVATTLAALGRLTPPARASDARAPASRVIFDAWVPSSGTLAAAARRATGRLLGLIGEPFKFSLAPDEAARMLSAAGWECLAVLDRSALSLAIGPERGAIHPDVCVIDAVRSSAPQESR